MEDNFELNKNSIADLRYNLNYYGADYPVDALVKRMKDEEFIFPNFQRQYVWHVDEASRFIESLLLGLPVPSIFLAKDKYSSKLIVIDGQQRLRTLQFFYEGKFPDGKAFKLKSVISELIGKTYYDLPVEDRFTLDNTIIHCLVISENEKSDSIFYLFERLNTTGTPLTNQEIRNAIYHGEFNDFLYKISQSEIWKSLYHKEEIRLEDQDLILRFIALNFELESYSGNMNEFLNRFMFHNRNFDLISRTLVEQAFFSSFNAIKEAIGEDAFYFKKTFNRPLYETLTLTVSRNHLQNKNTLAEFYKILISSDDFWLMTKSSTTSKKSIMTRIEFANHLLSQII
ncbi:GmrSD restriction endonuclease domain-containing protein [Spirosoma linguale]|uniref:GmrSD restriction endonucleases N-terminal domain-containing protein n=1 Tax=Spirosoma linguale (strain ATCC 33905 / DSM 74 / LMG 10896 / Claus 1) TaxID=504472 RepID=D2QBE8_SPILD|nr:protein of unknown function DUF262 [Spirosoma linguale DSM 74]